MTLILRDIQHRYGDVEALCGASVEAASGEIVCLFGPSGCGKTTLLRIAAGLEILQGGAVSLDGATLAAPGVFTPPERRSTGYVFQDYVLFPHLTARANIAFGLSGAPAAQRKHRVALELQAMGLSGLGDRYPHELSGGQQQRVALARAFARRPRAMLLDEPFASIDSVLRRRLRQDLRHVLKKNGAATLLVTHDPEEALALGDRIAIMAAGSVIETASPRALWDAPKTPEGAQIFPGSQAFEAVCNAGVAASPFGQVTAPGASDGPAIVVVRPGGVRVAADRGGALRVVESRFAGPHWRVLVARPDDQAAAVWADANEALADDAAVSVSFEADRVRLFPRAA